MIAFFVPGHPRATQTGSIIRVRGRSFPIRRGTAWSSYCGYVAREYAPQKPLEGPVDVTLLFSLSKPKHPKQQEPISRPDVENLSKGLLDSWNGILWRDDSQIVRLCLQKIYSTDGRVGVYVTCGPFRLVGASQ